MSRHTGINRPSTADFARGKFAPAGETETISEVMTRLRGAPRDAFLGPAGTFTQIVFPSSLNEETGLRPVVQFVCKGGRGHNAGSIILPAPSSFATADSAQYGSAELGFGGKLAMDLTQTAITEGGDSAMSAIEGAANKIMGDLKGAFSGDKDIQNALVGGASLAFGADLQGEEGIGKGVAMAIGATFNKNVTTEFTSVSTRSFSFTYELVPSSQDEGQHIHNMIVAFREAIYPASAAEGSVLRYPPKWTIKFLEKADGDAARLRSFPALAECYLESFSTTYNGNNSFHVDGRPVKTDITFSFKEDRSLTLDDIRKLEETT